MYQNCQNHKIIGITIISIRITKITVCITIHLIYITVVIIVIRSIRISIVVSINRSSTNIRSIIILSINRNGTNISNVCRNNTNPIFTIVITIFIIEIIIVLL